MGMTSLYQLAVIPAFLISLAALLALHSQDEAKAGRRLLWFLLATGIILPLFGYLVARFAPAPYPLFFQAASLLTPVLVGILALILLNLKWLQTMNRQGRLVTMLLTAGLVMSLVTLFGSSRWDQGFQIIVALIPLLLGWFLSRRYPRLSVILALASLPYLFLILLLSTGLLPDNLSLGWLVYPLMILSYLLPGVMVALAAMLIRTALSPVTAPPEGNSAVNSWRIGPAAKTILALGLVGSLAYVIFWGSVWDQTSDGLTGIFLARNASLVAVGIGMVTAVTASGKARLGGFLFLFLAPLLILQAFAVGWRVSYHAITEERAARIATALDQFHRREGHYPQTLANLTPRDLLTIQRPIILRAENWCYEGSDDYYRLATFYREFFSGPVSLRVYASGGEPPSGEWLCEARLAEVKERYRSFADSPAALRPPLPTPLPPIDVGIAKTPVPPVLDGVPVAAGSWSPDSRYFVFGALNGSMRLHFLNGRTGEICEDDGRFDYVGQLRQQYAWLPDGRLLYLDPGGEMVVLTPCQPGAERLTSLLPAPFNRIAADDQASGQLLLLDERMEAGSFWIMDGRTYTLTPIPDVTPNTYDLHWDNATWLPGGQHLVISRLDGRRGSNAGATLFLINGDSGQVELSHHLPGDFGQSAPPVEGLSPWEVVLHGQGELFLVDFRADPPAFVNVFADIFQLDINFPHDISAYGTYVDEPENGYYLATRLNHPRSQATYLYHSATGQIHRYEHENHTLLLFPNGRLVEMANWENVPAYQDSYDPVLVADPGREQATLSLTGHTPREHPHLSLRYLSQTSQIAVASAHGVSLVSWPEGEMITYWDLVGPGFSPWLISSPDGGAFVAVKEGGGLYGPLPGREE